MLDDEVNVLVILVGKKSLNKIINQFKMQETLLYKKQSQPQLKIVFAWNIKGVFMLKHTVYNPISGQSSFSNSAYAEHLMLTSCPLS